MSASGAASVTIVSGAIESSKSIGEPSAKVPESASETGEIVPSASARSPSGRLKPVPKTKTCAPPLKVRTRRKAPPWISVHEVVVGAVVLLVQLDRPRQPLPALRLVPLPHHAAPVARAPGAGAEGQAHVESQAVVRRPRHRVLALAADLHDRGDAAAQELGQSLAPR